MSDVIVTDGLWRKSLSALRSLGKAEYSVHVIGNSIFTTGFWSRYTTSKTIAPSASENEDEFIAKLEQRAKLCQTKPTLLPMEDATLLAVSKRRNTLNKYMDFLLPPELSLAVAENKAETMHLAQKLRIACPKTFFPTTPQELVRMLHKLTVQKYIVKPYFGSGSAGIVYTLKQSAAFWLEHWKTYGKLLIQERIPQEGIARGVSLLFDQHGECVASFAHQRLQQYPNSGGPSTDRISIEDPKLVAQSIALMKKLHWKGIAMVEWKLDPHTSQPKLMEINPRFWGSLELAVRSGVDFPLLYVQAAQGRKVVPVHAYKPTRCRWLIPGDMLRYITQPAAKRESLLTFLQGLPGLAEEWDMKDLPGFFASLVCTFILALHPKYWKYVQRG